jgi:hypothetical protein
MSASHDDDHSCPHLPRIDAATRALRRVIPAFLAEVGLTDLVEVTLVLRGTKCGCRTIVTAGPEEAELAAQELLSAAATTMVTR